MASSVFFCLFTGFPPSSKFVGEMKGFSVIDEYCSYRPPSRQAHKGTKIPALDMIENVVYNAEGRELEYKVFPPQGIDDESAFAPSLIFSHLPVTIAFERRSISF